MLNQFWKFVGKRSASSLEPEGQFELQPCLFTLRLARHDVEFRFYLQMGGNICWRTANLMQPWKFSVDHFYKYPLDLSSSYGINLKDLIYVVHYYYYYFSKACIPLFKYIPKQPLLNSSSKHMANCNSPFVFLIFFQEWTNAVANSPF